ncbi:MAG: GAF domain-containing protein [Anaerolineales bacterium]|uniref:GAF domain-containing protein n=1 Tax=Candidatus Desulfolinea nitratireducens TaxID=2841698 RepID=A0A8J6TIB5_9CHLR|nr:GAF domain-containing protein [Candidatus Desulfolinea nitratireducens]MBL6959758.1 GAF domain-containing protein [Anaerolineales bacterium]
MISPSPTPGVPKTNHEENVLEAWRATVFATVIRTVAILGTIAYFVGIALAYKNLTPVFFLSYTAAYIWVMATAFFTRVPIKYRAYSFTLIVLSIGLLSSFERAAIGDGRIWLILSAVLAAIFLGRRAGLAFTIAITLIWAITGYLFISSAIPVPELEQFSISIWGGTTVTLVIVTFTIILSIGVLLVNLNKTIEDRSMLAGRAAEQSHLLETQHNALERRSNALEASAKISRKLAALVTPQDILNEITHLLREDFMLNSAAVFLFDANRDLRLASSNGWNEQAYPPDSFVLPINEDIVGLAIIEGQAYSNIDTDRGLKTALLGTNSYAAIPLRGRSDVMGALLIQSEKSEAFGDGRVSILQILADQTALLIENAELFAKQESALEAERRAYGEITQKAWGEYIESQKFGAYLRDKNGLTSVPAEPYDPSAKQRESEKIPITIRGKVVGYIDAHKPKDRAWTNSERELLRILASRLESAMDSARLYQASQHRAERELIISETSTRMRETLDIESVLETAAIELRKALGIAEAEVWVSADPQDNNAIGDK